VGWARADALHIGAEPATAVRADDALLSLFFSLPIDVVAAEARMAEMRDALRARAASVTYPPLVGGRASMGEMVPMG
jgi:hypothetical protein